jgi:hypothetical protein
MMFCKYLKNIGLANIFRVGAKSSTVTNMSYSTQIPRTCPFTLDNRMNFLPLTEYSSTNNLGQVKAFQQIEAEKCD